MPLFDGLDEIIRNSLGIAAPRFGQPGSYSRTAAIWISEKCREPLPEEIRITNLVSVCMNRVLANYDAAPVRTPVPSSNWSWTKSQDLAPHNRSQEKLFEKLVVYLFDEQWVNQMVTSNGVMQEGQANAFRIDLVNRTRDDAYDLIELKFATNDQAGSDNPLHAAIEIFKYGLLYFLFRQRNLFGEHIPDACHILKARSIRLVVLAPARWYRYVTKGVEHRFDLSFLEQQLTDQLNSYARQHVADLNSISLVFEEFSPEFQITCDQLINSVMNFRQDELNGRIQLYPPARTT